MTREQHILYSVAHCPVGGYSPIWYHLDAHSTLESATRYARNYALDHGGYVCVRDKTSKTVWGTDPAALDRAILSGTNNSFPRETARLMGCVS